MDASIPIADARAEIDAAVALVDAPQAIEIDAATPDSPVTDGALPDAPAPPDASPTPDATAAAPDAPPPPTCTLSLLADDSSISPTFLGIASSNSALPDSVCNPNGLYGSSFGIYSIYNPNGLYGSSFGVWSAYNEFSVFPPFLYCAATKQRLNTVSKNQFALGFPIDPDVLCAVLAQNGY